MSVKDINGGKITKKEAKAIINDVLATAPEGTEFKGAVPQGQEASAETFTLPRTVEDAQRTEINLRNGGDTRAAGQFAQGFLGTIAQKLIYQTILTAPYSDDFAFIERFRGENIDFGSAKEYVSMQMSGPNDFDPEAFLPVRTTKPTAISQVNSFLNSRGELNTDANAFMKQFKISIQQYATKEFMLSDVKLQQFVENMRDAVINGAKLFLFNKIMFMIKDGITNASTTPNGVKWTLIEGQATNMFDAMVEICTHVKKLTKLGNNYQLVKSTNASENLIRASSYNNLTWIWSIDNDEKASRGVKSQLYHYKLWDKDNFIDERNVYTPYKRISLPDLTSTSANNYPTQTNEDWIDNNTVVILENNAIEFNLVWEKTETQYYTNNMTLQLTYNIAGMVNPVKVMRGFVYKNPNLSIIP